MEYNYVPNTNNRYIAYENGLIFDIEKNIYLKQTKRKSGYYYCGIVYNSGYKSDAVHRIMAKTFLSNVENKPQVNHKDADKSNNHVKNLEWCTSQENMTHLSKNKLNSRAISCCLIKDDKIIETYESLSVVVRKYGLDRSNIKSSCDGIYSGTRGFKIRYYDYNTNEWIKTKYDTELKGSLSKCRMNIKCVENGKIYKTQQQASDDLNIPQSTISNILNGKQSGEYTLIRLPYLKTE